MKQAMNGPKEPTQEERGAYKSWWLALTAKGDPRQRTHLSEEAFVAGIAYARAEKSDLPLDSYCEGCGEEKTYRGKEASSFVACQRCFKKLPEWLRNAFVNSGINPQGGPTLWETRLREYLRWMAEAECAAPQEDAL
jgi:hypothetical protein